MGVADARAMHPSIEIVEAEPEADRRLLEALADWCDRYTPLVALDGPDGLLLDITGCSHLFSGEARMLDDIVRRFLDQGFMARAGLASTPGAAWAAARFSLQPMLLDRGAEADFLSRLPLAALRLDAGACAALESVGLRTVEAVMAAPRAPLARRFGRTLLLHLDRSLGRVEEALSPRMPVPPLSVERALVEPVGEIEEIERLVLLLADGLKQELERRGEGARALELLLFRVDGVVARIAVGASTPLREPRRIGALFHERLASLETDLDVGYGFDLVRLSAAATEGFEAAQADLSGDSASRGENVAHFVDRVRARLGGHAILTPVPAESHLPERAAPLLPFAGTSLAGTTAPSPRSPAPERPLRFFERPEPIHVPLTEVPEGPPLHFRWRRVLHRVARAEGPERIAPEWWRDAAGSPTRDYYRVEDMRGHRYWLFREGLYDATPEGPRWYLQGISA